MPRHIRGLNESESGRSSCSGPGTNGGIAHEDDAAERHSAATLLHTRFGRRRPGPAFGDDVARQKERYRYFAKGKNQLDDFPSEGFDRDLPGPGRRRRCGGGGFCGVMLARVFSISLEKVNALWSGPGSQAVCCCTQSGSKSGLRINHAIESRAARSC